MLVSTIAAANYLKKYFGRNCCFEDLDGRWAVEGSSFATRIIRINLGKFDIGKFEDFMGSERS